MDDRFGDSNGSGGDNEGICYSSEQSAAAAAVLEMSYMDAQLMWLPWTIETLLLLG